MKGPPRICFISRAILMFYLDRADVLPVGNLGIREAMCMLYDLFARLLPVQMERIAESWRLSRTLANRYLWRALDG